MKQVNVKKLILPNIPYVFIALLATKVGEAVRLAPGSDASTKLLKKNKYGAYVNGIWMVVILSGSIILAQVLVPNADTVLRQLTQLNSVTMPMRYLWVFFAYIMLRKHNEKFSREYKFVKNNGVALGFGIWCFFLTAACCLLGMYKQGDLYTTLLNVITPVVLVALGLILPAIKKREGKAS